jgi:DNA invertase Pin-like site-specific DNA recombinase
LPADLAVQLAGHDHLNKLGISLIPASAPDFFLADTPTAVLVRQVLGAIAQFEKASLIAMLKAARERKRKADGRCEGNKPLSETRPELVGAGPQTVGFEVLRAISAVQRSRWQGIAVRTPERRDKSASLRKRRNCCATAK